jgi:hypothetical protein
MDMEPLNFTEREDGGVWVWPKGCEDPVIQHPQVNPPMRPMPAWCHDMNEWVQHEAQRESDIRTGKIKP